jgi:hypothetical protein
MDRRTHESPMDFEWQTQGPADVTSPFYKLSQSQAQRRKLPFLVGKLNAHKPLTLL